MAEAKPLVRNAADPQQVATAKKTEATRRKDELTDLAEVCDSVAGRRFLWRVMDKCGANRSVYDGHGSRMAYQSGQQDIGHFLMAEITEASPTAMLRMMQDAGTIEANRVEPTPSPDE